MRKPDKKEGPKKYRKPRPAPRHEPHENVPIWSPQDLLYKLNISPRTMQKWVSQKILVPCQIGKKKWFLEKDVIATLEKHKLQ